MPKISKELVSAILEAGTGLLKEVGKEKLSLQKVSELAGTSVNNIYKHFPNKEALIHALIEREADRHLEILEKRYAEIKSQSFEQKVETLVIEIASAVKKGKLGIRVILTSTFAVERLESLIYARRSLVTFVQKVLEDEGITKDSHIKAYTIVACLGGLVETMAFKRDESITDEDLARETTKWVLAYSRL
jgi:AcrR family transcriptional regulator